MDVLNTAIFSYFRSDLPRINPEAVLKIFMNLNATPEGFVRYDDRIEMMSAAVDGSSGLAFD